MKISEYIAALEAIKAEHGNLEVEKLNGVFDRVSANSPEIAYRKILNKKESKPEFWADWYPKQKEQKGEKVVRI